MSQRWWAGLLFAAALVMVIVGGIWWGHESNRVAKANAQSSLTRGFGDALFGPGGGAQPANVSASRTGQYVLFAGAGLAGAVGILLLAGAEAGVDGDGDVSTSTPPSPTDGTFT